RRLIVVGDVAGGGVGADAERGVGAAHIVGRAVELDREGFRRLEDVVVDDVDRDGRGGGAGQNGDAAGAAVGEIAAGHGGAVDQVIGDHGVVVGRIGQADLEADGAVGALERRV